MKWSRVGTSYNSMGCHLHCKQLLLELSSVQPPELYAVVLFGATSETKQNKPPKNKQKNQSSQ